MTRRLNGVIGGSDELYWGDRNAAQPVLLIDDATQSITEALHRIRSGPRLNDRDLAAAEEVLGYLYGGMGQLAELLINSVAPRPRSRLPEGGFDTCAYQCEAL